MRDPFALFGWLLVGHALCDYALQTDFIARGKNRRLPIPGVPFIYPLAAHALIHGGAVALITGSWQLAVLETVVHACIDDAKCDGWFGMHVDQALHIACKVLWVVLLVAL